MTHQDEIRQRCLVFAFLGGLFLGSAGWLWIKDLHGAALVLSFASGFAASIAYTQGKLLDLHNAISAEEDDAPQ